MSHTRIAVATVDSAKLADAMLYYSVPKLVSIDGMGYKLAFGVKEALVCISL